MSAHGSRWAAAARPMRALELARPLLALAAAALLAGCARVSPPTAPGALTGVDFTNYVAVGNSLTAGFQSGGLLDAHQDAAYPVLLARQAGLAAFPHPRISDPGFPGLLELDFSHPEPPLPFSILTPSELGGLENPEQAPYQNLGVPGARIVDFFANDPTNPMFALLLGERGSMWQQLKARHPRFVTFWLGSNDALNALLVGDPSVMTPADVFSAAYGAALDSVLSTGAQVAAANIPGILDTPFATTVPPYAFDPVTGRPITFLGQKIYFLGQRDDGTHGTLEPGSLVTLPALSYLANGDGIPALLGGSGRPLPDSVVLTPNEVAAIRTRTGQFNATIRDSCAAHHVPVMDANALFHLLKGSGYSLGGVVFTTQWVQGGIISLDGIHPTDLGQALMANQWIATIDGFYGANLRPVSLRPFLSVPTAPAASAPGGSPLAGLVRAARNVDWARVTRYGF
ncbi:MAG TPA: SGNH/GDSL hydrolase family protein [Candidatus Saccharimonadales bacterium]|nr:SGNH/GDSL hydrolase family protein [Candidatus Saccharimonadales bacterium]